MDVIPISKEKFDSLQKFILSDMNTEGILYTLHYNGSVKLLKRLYVNDGIALAKKLFTIEMLNSNDLPNYFVIPDCLITVDNNVVGFTIPFIEGKTLKDILDNKDVSIKIKIEYLKKVGLILEEMAKIRTNSSLKHFYLNDIHESNFMIDSNTKELCVVDLDGCKINASFSFPARYLTRNALLNNTSKYHIEPDLRHGAYVMANKDSELYCYIIMILNYLYGDYINNIEIKNFYEYLNYLEFIGIDGKLLDCFSRIVVDGENINPMEYLDSITETQIFRAKKKVYDIVRRKSN